MKEIKILQVIGGLNRGGAETMLMNIYRKINRKKFRFIFLIYVSDETKADYEEEILGNNDTIIKLDRNRVKNPILFYHDLSDLMKNEKYDCVHAHTLFNSGIVMYVAYKNHIPTRITHSHSSGNMKKNTIINRSYFKFAKYLISKYSTNYIACDINAGKYLFGNQFSGPILHNGIDLQRFCFGTKEKDSIYQNILDDEYINMAIIGSFYEVKNHMFLIPMAKRLKEKGIKFRIYFAGRGPLKAVLEKEIKEQELEQEMIFLGIINKIDEFLQYIDIVLMPSLYEGVPVSLIEAQAAGVPAIISNNIARDVDMDLGLLYFLKIDSNEEWIETILKLNKKKKELLPGKIYDTLTDKGYNVERNIDLVCDIYESNQIY